MTPSRPYLIRALYEWILDNDLTPYILVDAGVEGVEVPQQFVDDGKIVLNVAPRAVQALDLGNEAVAFEARFSGQAQLLYIPIGAVMAIYARENGQGMMFGDDDGGGDDTPPTDSGPDGSGKSEGRPALRVVK